MDPVKYANICEYLRNQGYPSDFSKHDKTVLRKFSKKIVYDERAGSLFYLDKARDGTVNRRLVIQEDEKKKVFDKCHSSSFAGHVGRDNTIKKIREQYYWPDYYKDTVEMVRLSP